MQKQKFAYQQVELKNYVWAFCVANNSQLAFLELVEDGKNTKECVARKCQSGGLLANDQATVPDGLPWTTCNFM